MKVMIRPSGSARLKAGNNVVVHGEIVDSLWEEDFTTVEDQQIIEDLRDRLKLYGLDPSQAEEMVKKAQTSPLRKRASAEPFPIQPQREWEEAKKRLNEQAKRLANVLLNHVDLKMNGFEIPYKYKSLGLSGNNNFICALMMVNTEIHKRLGKERSEASIEQFRGILDNLDDVLKPLVRRLRKAKSDYEENQT